MEAEQDRGRNDLVLPIYYIHCRLLEDPSLRENDLLASVIHERQREDWRERRFKPFDDPEVRRSLEALASKIDEARSRAWQEQEAAGRRAAEGQGRRAEHAEAVPRVDEGRHRPDANGLEPGTVLRDAPWCPELVVVQ